MTDFAEDMKAMQRHYDARNLILRPAGHGYESDAAAVRVIVSIYSEAAIDARLACAREWDGGSGQAYSAAVNRWIAIRDAAEAIAYVWAREIAFPSETMTLERRIALMPTCRPEGERRWFETVAADIRARLAGDMSRPIPEPLIPEGT